MVTDRALILHRRDFRESSRLVTLVTRGHGKLTALAKGAHRPGSNLIGRLDLLNLCDVTLVGRGLPLLSRAALVHEPRALRRPPRFLYAIHLVEVFDAAFLEGRTDDELFDLLPGAVTLIERAPLTHLPLVLAGVELRFLRALGLLGPLNECSQCGATLERRQPLYAARSGEGGVYCRDHRPQASEAVPGPVLRWLEELGRRPGKEWPGMRGTAHARRALELLGPRLAAALEFRPHMRAAVLRSSSRRAAETADAR